MDQMHSQAIILNVNTLAKKVRRLRKDQQPSLPPAYAVRFKRSRWSMGRAGWGARWPRE